MREEAETTKLLAFNQGFYNLFLAIVTAIGIVAIWMGHTAVTQGTFPLIAVVLLVLGLAV